VVLEAARRYARSLLDADPRVVRVGVFGSYSRGADGPGSDVDLLVEMSDADPSPRERYLALPPPSLPVPADVIILTSAEIDRRRAESARWNREVLEGACWLVDRH
jgi:predicted nucleotidyltransferase